jgi:hypothetical protein
VNRSMSLLITPRLIRHSVKSSRVLSVLFNTLSRLIEAPNS